MKKQLFGLALACSLSLTVMKQFGAPASVRNTKPSLMAILKQKYIDRQPLTKDQQEYLNKAKKPAIAAGLVALGIGATAAGILAYRGKKRKTKSPSPKLPPPPPPGTPPAVLAQQVFEQPPINQQPPKETPHLQAKALFLVIGLTGNDLEYAVEFATAPDLVELFDRPGYMRAYAYLSDKKGFKSVLAKARGVEKLPYVGVIE